MSKPSHLPTNLCRTFIRSLPVKALRPKPHERLAREGRNSFSGIVNSVKPQCKQTTSFGHTKNGGFVQTLKSGKMDRNFAVKRALLVRRITFAGHGSPKPKFRLVFNEDGSDAAIVTDGLQAWPTLYPNDC